LKNGFIDVNSVVQGSVFGCHAVPLEYQKTLSVIVGEREYKWPLEDIFKKPGLMTTTSAAASQVYRDTPEVQTLPWRFFTSEGSDPTTFGYRTVITEFDYSLCRYRPIREDAMMFPDEVLDCEDDLHRGHRPRQCPSIDSNENWNVSDFNRKSGSVNHQQMNRMLMNNTKRPFLMRASSMPAKSQAPRKMVMNIAQNETITRGISDCKDLQKDQHFQNKIAVESWSNDCGFYSCRSRSVIRENEKTTEGGYFDEEINSEECHDKIQSELQDVQIPDLLKFSASKLSSARISESGPPRRHEIINSYADENSNTKLLEKDEVFESVPPFHPSMSVPFKVLPPRLSIRKTELQMNQHDSEKSGMIAVAEGVSFVVEGVRANEVRDCSSREGSGCSKDFRRSLFIPNISSLTSDINMAPTLTLEKVVSVTPVESMLLQPSTISSIETDKRNNCDSKIVDNSLATGGNIHKGDFMSFKDFLGVIHVDESVDAKLPLNPCVVDSKLLIDADRPTKLSTNVVNISKSGTFAPNVVNLNNFIKFNTRSTSSSDVLVMNDRLSCNIIQRNNRYDNSKEQGHNNDISSGVTAKINKNGYNYIIHQRSEIPKPVFTADVSMMAVSETDCDIINNCGYIPLQIVPRQEATIVGPENMSSQESVSKLKMNIRRVSNNSGVLVTNL